MEKRPHTEDREVLDLDHSYRIDCSATWPAQTNAFDGRKSLINPKAVKAAATSSTLYFQLGQQFRRRHDFGVGI